jgi:hypothetical protein
MNDIYAGLILLKLKLNWRMLAAVEVWNIDSAPVNHTLCLFI